MDREGLYSVIQYNQTFSHSKRAGRRESGIKPLPLTGGVHCTSTARQAAIDAQSQHGLGHEGVDELVAIVREQETRIGHVQHPLPLFLCHCPSHHLPNIETPGARGQGGRGWVWSKQEGSDGV